MTALLPNIHPPPALPHSTRVSPGEEGTVLHCIELLYTVLQCTAVHCTALYCTALYWTCTALHYIVLALHCTTAPYSEALYFNEMYCTELYCTTLQCTMYNVPLAATQRTVRSQISTESRRRHSRDHTCNTL